LKDGLSSRDARIDQLKKRIDDLATANDMLVKRIGELKS
jgi:hypothetical protein